MRKKIYPVIKRIKKYLIVHRKNIKNVFFLVMKRILKNVYSGFKIIKEKPQVTIH